MPEGFKIFKNFAYKTATELFAGNPVLDIFIQRSHPFYGMLPYALYQKFSGLERMEVPQIDNWKPRVITYGEVTAIEYTGTSYTNEISVVGMWHIKFLPTDSFGLDDFYEAYKNPSLSRILKGEICPYCGDEANRVDSKVVYGKSYGEIMLCAACDAYVGVHKEGKYEGNALGMLANRTTRQQRIKAHGYFDTLYMKAAKARKVSKLTARNLMYEWLSKQMGYPRMVTHIGMFNNTECDLVIELCSQYVDKSEVKLKS